MLKSQKNFLKSRTNSKEIDIKTLDTTEKEETFKNNIEFRIKGKRGKIEIK
jgi:hypothetical protein